MGRGGKRRKENKELGIGIDRKRRTIIIVIAHHHLLRLAVAAHLAPEVLVEGVEVVLQLRRVHLVLRVVRRVLVQVRQEDGLRVGRLHVLPAAAVPVPARADLVVEGAVHFVLLRAEDGGEVAVWVWLVHDGRKGGWREGLTWPCLRYW